VKHFKLITKRKHLFLFQMTSNFVLTLFVVDLLVAFQTRQLSKDNPFKPWSRYVSSYGPALLKTHISRIQLWPFSSELKASVTSCKYRCVKRNDKRLPKLEQHVRSQIIFSWQCLLRANSCKRNRLNMYQRRGTVYTPMTITGRAV